MKYQPRSDSPISVLELADLYILDGIKGFGPQKFKQLHQAGLSPSQVIENPDLLPVEGKRGVPLRKQLREQRQALRRDCVPRAEKQLDIARRLDARILTYRSSHYPANLYESNHPIPILYVRGNIAALESTKSVACVGSRKITHRYAELHAAFVRFATGKGFTIISGFALGADTVGHRHAVESGGKTVCVMPSGLDRPFPPENKSLWQEFLASSRAAFVSEFPFGTGAVALNLRKRNKTIVAFALGVLVSQSSKTGGAMNAYRFAAEQKKPIATFRDDGTDDTSGNLAIAEDRKARTTEFATTGNLNEFAAWLREL